MKANSELQQAINQTIKNNLAREQEQRELLAAAKFRSDYPNDYDNLSPFEKTMCWVTASLLGVLALFIVFGLATGCSGVATYVACS